MLAFNKVIKHYEYGTFTTIENGFLLRKRVGNGMGLSQSTLTGMLMDTPLEIRFWPVMEM